MGGKSKTTQTTSIDPGVLQLQKDRYSAAQSLTSQPVVPYSGSLNLGGSLNAAQGLLAFQAPQVSAQGYNAATGAASVLAPARLALAALIDRSGVRDLNSPSLTSVDLKGYLNPYTQNVIDAYNAQSLRDQGRQAQADKASAIAAGAFGGDREGVQRALTEGLAQASRDSNAANLLSQGYANAQAAAQADLARRLQADTANQSMDYNVSAANAGNQQQADLANAAALNTRSLTQGQLDQSMAQFNLGAQNAASQFNADAALRAALGNQQASLASAGVQQNAANLLGQLNSQQGAFDYAEWLRQQNAPYDRQALLNQTLAAIQAPTTTSSATTPSLLQNLQAGGDFAKAMAETYLQGKAK